MRLSLLPLPLALATLLASTPLQAAEPQPADSSLLPGASVADSNGYLYRDVMRTFSAFVTEHYNCAPYHVLATRRSAIEGRLVLDHDGHVLSGAAQEQWDVDICGEQMTLAVEIAPRDQWGTVVRFNRNEGAKG